MSLRTTNSGLRPLATANAAVPLTDPLAAHHRSHFDGHDEPSRKRPAVLLIVAELRTDRVLLREWQERERVPFAHLNADTEVMRHLPAPLSRAKVTRSLTGSWLTSSGADGAYGRSKSVRLGGFSVSRGLAPVTFQAPFTPATEVGWRLRRDPWGRGFASEAARAALVFAFSDDGLALEEVVSFTARGNERSRAVMGRLGMRRDPAGDFDHPALLSAVAYAGTCFTESGPSRLDSRSSRARRHQATVSA
jgi:RimJ/RimL family protein N-acetyltransferase